MTILQTADAMGGVWTYALALARAVPQHNFVIATMGDWPSEAQIEAASQLPNIVLKPSNWKLEWMNSPWHDVEKAGEWLLELEREFAPDIVHLGGFLHGVLPFRAPKIVVAHSCVLSWWRAVKGEDAPAEWNSFQQKVSAGLRGADAVVAPTHAMDDELRRLYDFNGEVQIIPNGADVPPLPRDDQNFVLGAGRVWDEAKNIAVLDEAALSVKWPIKIAGDALGPEGKHVEAHHLELLGFQSGEAMPRLRSQAPIWAHPALYEPFGLAVLEAAASGCALVLSDIPTLRELWDGAATFVSPRDASAWAEALNRLIEAPDERLQWGQKARERAARYNLKAFSDGYQALYEQLTR